MGIPPQGIGGGEIIISGGAGKEAERFILVAASDADESIKSVADYVCDGVNDEEEINQAIQQAVSEGIYTVVLSEGTFNVEPHTIELMGGTLYCCIPITSSNVRLIGCGDKTVISLKPELTEEYAFVIAITGNETEYINNISLENLNIKTNYQPYRHFLLLLTAVDNSSIANIILDSSESSNYGMFTSTLCQNISVTNIVSYNTATRIMYSSNFKVTDSTLYLNSDLTTALTVLDSSKVTINRNTIYSSNYTISLYNSNFVSITQNLLNNLTEIRVSSEILFSNNQVIDSGQAIYTYTPLRCILSNNIFYSNKETSVIIKLANGDDYCVVTNNIIYATNFTGQNPIEYTGSNHVIANNIIIVESGGG